MSYLALMMYELFLGNCGRPLKTVTAEVNGDIQMLARHQKSMTFEIHFSTILYQVVMNVLYIVYLRGM